MLSRFAAAAIATAAPAEDVYIPHPMSTLHEKREMLRTIPDDWLMNHNVPKRFQNCRAYSTKDEKSSYRLSIMGCTFTKNTDELIVSDEHHDFDCAYNDCDAQIRVYNAGHHFANTTSTRVLHLDSIEVELLRRHSCALVTHQATVLKYLDILRRHLLKDEKHKLTSHMGFYIFEEGIGPRGTVPTSVIFDHLFEWRGRPQSNSYKHAYCNNGLKLTCGVDKEGPCGAEVDIRSIRTYNSEVVGESGKHSKDISGSTLYECKLYDEIQDVNKKCTNPIYKFMKMNVLSNGLSSIIPKLDDYVYACDWIDGYREYSLFVDAELKYPADIYPADDEFFRVEDVDPEDVIAMELYIGSCIELNDEFLNVEDVDDGELDAIVAQYGNLPHGNEDAMDIDEPNQLNQ